MLPISHGSIQRWTGRAVGRSRTVACDGLVWTVANAVDATAPFEAQVAESLQMLELHLVEAGSDRTRILSLQVMLADIAQRPAFDEQWQARIGPSPEHWPQRACFQAALAPGLLIEVVVVAARAP